MVDNVTVGLDEAFDDEARIGIIGGYGFTNKIDIKAEISVETPFGEPSHPLVVGEMAGRPVAFVSRHGQGRNIPSPQVPYRANIFALHRISVRRIVSATANGSLAEEMAVGDIAVPSDYIDHTKFRKDTFFDEYPPHHFSSKHPFCADVRDLIDEHAPSVGLTSHSGDITVVIIEGPRFATDAESVMFQKWGADMIGGSTYPEMALARELDMCYANFALLTDYDAGSTVRGVSADPVTLTMIDEVISEHKVETQELMEAVVANLSTDPCDECTGHVTDARSEGDPKWEYHR